MEKVYMLSLAHKEGIKNLRALCKQCGIAYSTFYRCFVAKTQIPRISTISLIAKQLNVSREEVIKLSE